MEGCILDRPMTIRDVTSEPLDRPTVLQPAFISSPSFSLKLPQHGAWPPNHYLEEGNKRRFGRIESSRAGMQEQRMQSSADLVEMGFS